MDKKQVDDILATVPSLRVRRAQMPVGRRIDMVYDAYGDYDQMWLGQMLGRTAGDGPVLVERAPLSITVPRAADTAARRVVPAGGSAPGRGGCEARRDA
jgi:hypothetical protein